MFVEDKKEGEFVCLTERTWRDTLNDAADLLERDGWCQGMYYAKVDNKLAHCALGAIWAVEGWDHRNMDLGCNYDLHPRALQATSRLYHTLGESIPYWNDNSAPNAQVVISTMRSVACL